MNIAIVDGSSSVLPYDYQLAKALAAQGVAIDFFGSRTGYNGELLEAMRALPNVTVHSRDVSRTVAPRWKGATQYFAMWLGLWRRRRRYDAVNLQFSALWPLELPFLFALRRRFVFTVHNAVPHEHAGRQHAPTRWIASLARTLVFPSRFTHDDFLRRYGERFRARSHVVAHGLSPAVPDAPLVPYEAPGRPRALVYWSTIKPYKGVELFAELARSERFRKLGLPLEVHGAWAAELHGLRDELVGLGVQVVDGFVAAPQLLALLQRPVVFLLPNREATQSGALYTLLHHGRFFLCTDVGDLGEFMRRFAIGALLLKERSADAVCDGLAALHEHGGELARAFRQAQEASSWAAATADLAAIYAGRDKPESRTADAMTMTRPAPRLLVSLPQLYGAAAVRLVVPLAVLPLVASRFGADEFGRLGFILVWAALLATLVEGGFLAATTRLAVGAGAAERWRLAQQVFSARCLLSLPAVLLSFAAVRWASPDAAHPFADSVAIAALACAFGWPATWYLQATQQLNRWARVEIVVYGCFIALSVLFARNVAAFVVFQFAASGALAWLGWRWLRRDLAGPAGGDSLLQGQAIAPGLRMGASMLPVSLFGAAYSLALPAAASAQLTKSELGIYFMADRIVRALLAAADPVFSVVYPRIVGRMRSSGRAALGYAARWAAAGAVAGALALAIAQAVWPLLEPVLASRAGGVDIQAVHAVASVLAWLWPLLLGWKFFGYWMLGSGRHDTAYRSSVIAGGIAGVAAAATLGGAAGAIGLAWTALGVELLVIAVAVVGMAAGRLLRQRAA